MQNEDAENSENAGFINIFFKPLCCVQSLNKSLHVLSFYLGSDTIITTENVLICLKLTKAVPYFHIITFLQIKNKIEK